MEFVFSEAKAAEAASVLLQAAGGRMPVWQLLALLYLADRQALIDTGYPTTGARFAAGAEGPVLEEVGELAQAGDCPGAWGRHVRPAVDGYLSGTGAPEVGELSEYDCDLLARTYEGFRGHSPAELGEHLRGLPEWLGRDRRGGALDPIAILRSDGYTDEDIEEAVGLADSVRWLVNLGKR